MKQENEADVGVGLLPGKEPPEHTEEKAEVLIAGDCPCES
jgi:hypothetical protein